MADINFDANEVEPSAGFSVLPGGDYEMVITESIWKPTSKGTGRYLKLTLVVIEGPFRNRKAWLNLNLDNPSQEAVQIARGQLRDICLAVGVPQPKDTQELHNLSMKVRLSVRDRPNGDQENRFVSFKKIGGPSAAVTNSTPPAPASSAPAGNSAPWKRPG